MAFLNRMNGWQRLWFVLTILAIAILGVFYPYKETYQFSPAMYHYRDSILKEFASGQCAAYQNRPISQLKEPPHSSGDGSCWHIYTSRRYAKSDIYPYTIEIYDREEEQRKSDNFIEASLAFSLMILIASGLLYFVGFIFAWIRRGFTQVA